MYQVDKRSKLCLCWLLVFACSSMGYGQRPSPGRVPGGQNSQNPEFSDVIFSKDTLDAQFYHLNDPSTQFEYNDTSIKYFHEYELEKIRGIQYFNLGYPGSPVRLVIPTIDERLGFHLGYDAYNPYRIDNHNFRFYRIKKALTYASYVQGQTQSDGLFRALFARNFKDGLQLSFEYNRTNNIGSYLRQSGQQTNLGVGLRYVSKNQKLSLHATHYANTFAQINNGGITTDTNFAELPQRLNVPVYLNDPASQAETRDQERVLQLQGTYRLTGKDSLRTGQGLIAEVLFRMDERSFKFFDENPVLEYYGNYWTHSSGVRNFLRNNRVVTHFNLRFAGKNPNQRFQVGIKNIANKIDLDFETEKLKDWMVTSQLNYSIKESLRLRGIGEFGSNKIGSSYLIKGAIDLDLGKAGVLSGILKINQRLPSQIERKLFLSQTQIWQNDFKNILDNQLSINYSIPSINFELTAGQIVSSNPIYFGSDARPIQLDGLSSLTYLNIYKSFRLGNFVNENRIILQQPGNNQVFRLPKWYSKNSLYFDGLLFKKILNLKTGFDVRLHESYDGVGYAPFIGQFILDDNHPISFYPSVDYNLTIRVGFLRAFVLLENILQPFQDGPYYQTSRYPRQDLTLRIGISWIFIN